MRVRDRNGNGFLHLLSFFGNQLERPFGVTIVKVHDVSHSMSAVKKDNAGDGLGQMEKPDWTMSNPAAEETFRKRL